MPVIRHAESRRTETPNAVMTTLASPTQGGTDQAVWRVDMRAGQSGPPHAIDTTQIWTVLAGAATVDLADAAVTIEPGDTLVIPADVPRRVTVTRPGGFAALVVAPAGCRAYRIDGDTMAPVANVPASARLTPAWSV
ncbi:cupin domain-containing protein [Solwaraspora sp. WMMD1047]|uniref:cupin domain-containing protein n=1 Tax=Solwaraspora sp. WMMD1047 TaxID=3016102 RepID=UPI002417D953|nr:cupin domain-containing protein [Solwaraspora sp. WMMD1047]MDG4832184.1 cupin domain-containing protein [Solwaraspora sp. WMMD1047]